jgi:hypothetical protein
LACRCLSTFSLRFLSLQAYRPRTFGRDFTVCVLRSPLGRGVHVCCGAKSPVTSTMYSSVVVVLLSIFKRTVRSGCCLRGIWEDCFGDDRRLDDPRRSLSNTLFTSCRITGIAKREASGHMTRPETSQEWWSLASPSCRLRPAVVGRLASMDLLSFLPPRHTTASIHATHAARRTMRHLKKLERLSTLSRPRSRFAGE